MSDELLTPREAAAFLKISLRAFYAWRRRHRIPSAIAGRVLRFRLDDLVVTRTPEADQARPWTREELTQAARAHARGEAWRH